MLSSEVGIVVMSNSNAIASNCEAARILAFPNTLSGDLVAEIPDDLRTFLVSSLSHSAQVSECQIWSGERRYHCLLLRADCEPFPVSCNVFVVLIRRVWHTSAEVELIAGQYGLTPRERECMEYLLMGLTNREIASRMKISASTVNSFLHLIMVKMGANSRCTIPLKIVNDLSTQPAYSTLD